MKHIVNPAQSELFDLFQSFLSPVAYDRLLSGYHAVFRHVILNLMPAEELGDHFHQVMGRPTKELYSMAGLVLLKEFHDWTTQEAVDAYLFDCRIQYALNIGRDNISFCERTLERYMKLIREDELAVTIFDRVTTHLIKELEIKVDQQRLDSTHVFSDMATFSRTKLMGVAIKRFLTQLNRHHTGLYNELPDELRERYEKRESGLFADVSKDKEKRSNLRLEVAEQMHDLIVRFAGNEAIENMTTFKHLNTVFNQQCEVIDVVPVERENDTGGDNENSDRNGANDHAQKEKTVEVRAKTGGNVIQNPSDPEATYDGHKGVGYQVQLAETSNCDNDVQLIVSALPQTAVESDAHAVEKVLQDLEEKGFMPERMTADALYGSDENVVHAKQKGVEIISPVAGAPPKESPDNPTPKQERLAERRELQETKEWREEYNSRAQIEGTIGSIKRKTGMVRLRYRGEVSIFAGILLKLTGWNISRAAASGKLDRKPGKSPAQALCVLALSRYRDLSAGLNACWPLFQAA